MRYPELSETPMCDEHTIVHDQKTSIDLPQSVWGLGFRVSRNPQHISAPIPQLEAETSPDPVQQVFQ